MPTMALRAIKFNFASSGASWTVFTSSDASDAVLTAPGFVGPLSIAAGTFFRPQLTVAMKDSLQTPKPG